MAVPLPSRAAYYLLDDFNHHHQHAVLTGTTARYASTHRVSRREGHTYAYILERCKKALASEQRSLKQVKLEQSALTEVEFEWIRQYHIQGPLHHQLHAWWHKPIRQLEALWARLEARTAERTAQLASVAAAAAESGGGEAACKLSQPEFLRLQACCVVLIGDLTRRKRLREAWSTRERDPVFRSLPPDCRPWTS